MRNLARAIWYRREACAWLVLVGALITVQTHTYGEFVPGPPPPHMDGGALVPSWPPETRRPTTTTLPSQGNPTTTAGQQTTTLPEGPGRGTGPIPPPGLTPTTTTLATTSTTTTTLATTTTKLCNRPGQPSQSTLRNGKPVVTREVDRHVVCTPA